MRGSAIRSAVSGGNNDARRLSAGGRLILDGVESLVLPHHQVLGGAPQDLAPLEGADILGEMLDNDAPAATEPMYHRAEGRDRGRTAGRAC